MALTTFSDLVHEARENAIADAKVAGVPGDGQGLDQGGSGAEAYGDAVAVYLALAISKMTAFHNSTARWRSGEGNLLRLLEDKLFPWSGITRKLILSLGLAVIGLE